MFCYYLNINTKQDFPDASIVNAKDGGVNFAMLFILREGRRTSDPPLSIVRGNLLKFHPWRLDSEALRPLEPFG